ncbi:hypothetical protein ACWCRD_13895 [Streptomyces sp. NPDC002092]
MTQEAELLPSSPAPLIRRPEAGTPPERPMDTAPDGWEANHAVLAQLAEHRVSWQP